MPQSQFQLKNPVSRICSKSEQSFKSWGRKLIVEISIGFEKIEEVEEYFPAHIFVQEALPWEAAFLAGKAFLSYRKRKGAKPTPLPDFYIGAHDLVSDYSLLTKDVRVALWCPPAFINS